MVAAEVRPNRDRKWSNFYAQKIAALSDFHEYLVGFIGLDFGRFDSIRGGWVRWKPDYSAFLGFRSPLHKKGGYHTGIHIRMCNPHCVECGSHLGTHHYNYIA